MPGRNNASNKFFSSPYLVGPVLGDGCSYSTVQSAIDDCFADGGGTVFIKKGTYVENLTLRPGIDLCGEDVDGRLPATFSHVVLQGNHSLTVAGGFSVCIANHITFSCLAGDTITLTATAGAFLIFAGKFCGYEGQIDPASRCVVMNADGTSAIQFSTDNSNIASTANTFECVGAGQGSAILSLGSVSASTGRVMQVTAGQGLLEGAYVQISSNDEIFHCDTLTSSCQFEYCRMFSNNYAINFAGGGGGATVRHCVIGSSDASGFWMTGAGSSVSWGDVLFVGSATAIDPVVISGKVNWQPFGEAGAAPGTLVPRGTSAFDSAHFSVSDGFVQALPAGIFPWVDQPASTTVVSNQGNFIVGPGVTLTLPAAPAQGDVCAFKDPINNGPYTVQANVGQFLQLGNQSSIAGGTCAGTGLGDAIHFTYYAASQVWSANSSIGNFILT